MRPTVHWNQFSRPLAPRRVFVNHKDGIVDARRAGEVAPRRWVRITGVVRDALTGLPVRGADVTTPSGAHAVTNRDGEFTLRGLRPGKMRVGATIGEMTMSVALELGAGESWSVRFQIGDPPAASGSGVGSGSGIGSGSGMGSGIASASGSRVVPFQLRPAM